ncbi:MFS transporter [Deinococcus detaillensis]|uniref:MFS transporter n=1 Tax=Deinococcus detaillensis TaxID=2592048 RepID=A0A553UWE1_9DEIO|nr:MFS transporter [Deinococcus detaillensis]TSA84524.1 MFS transporter [Deinococcus detaillensis]
MITDTPELALPRGWRTFLTLWASQSLSLLATNVAWFAITIYFTTVVYAADSQRPQLALMVGALGLLTSGPQIILAPLAGSITDRYSRRSIMLICDSVSALVALMVTLVVWSGSLNVPLLLLGVLLGRVAAVFHESAFEASYAMLLPEAQLARANGLMQTSYSAGAILAPALAALIIAFPQHLSGGLWGLGNGTGLVMVLDTLSFVVAALVLFWLRIPSPQERPAPGAKTDFRADFKLGWHYISRRRPMLLLVLLVGVTNFALAGVNLYETLLARFNLDADFVQRGLSFESGYAIMTTVTGVGTLLGGLIISSWGGLKRNRIFGLLIPLLVQSLAVLTMGLSRSLPLTCAALLIFGLSYPLGGAHSAAIWMSQVPRELQGRVFSVRRVVGQSSIPLGMVVFSVLSARFVPGPVVAVFGVVAVLAIVSALLGKQVRRVEDKTYLDELAAQAS